MDACWFAIPWHEHLVVGTTDVGVPRAEMEPRSSVQEQQFLREHVRRYLGREIEEADVLSVWSGLRPLVKTGNAATSKISRDHKVMVAGNGMVTVVGGKWTTYRRMGQDTMDRAAEVGGLAKVASRTESLRLHGASDGGGAALGAWEVVYGTGADAVRGAERDGSGAGGDARRATAVPCAGCGLGRAARDGADDRGCAGETPSGVVSGCAGDACDCRKGGGALVGAELGRDEIAIERDLKAFQAIADGYVYRERAETKGKGGLA